MSEKPEMKIEDAVAICKKYKLRYWLYIDSVAGKFTIFLRSGDYEPPEFSNGVHSPIIDLEDMVNFVQP